MWNCGCTITSNTDIEHYWTWFSQSSNSTGSFQSLQYRKSFQKCWFFSFWEGKQFFCPLVKLGHFCKFVFVKIDFTNFFFFLHFFEDFSILWFISWCPNPRAFYIVYQQPAAPIDIAHLTSKFVIIHQLWMVVNFFLAMPGRIAISSFCLD